MIAQWWAKLRALSRHRFVKFGTVGALGIPVNQLVLYLGQEQVFRAVTTPELRLNASLALAIFCATANNFFWNRRWTWADRRELNQQPIVLQFARYALGCWVGIALQFGLTNGLVWAGLHYMPANLMAIALASLFNYLVNDRWTFARRSAARSSE
jgi:dolichol-phosphate mannosyltransferase